MKSLKSYIQEKLTIKKSKYNYFPETKEELKDIIKQRIEKEGNEVNLNDIDVSNITDMSELFYGLKNFNGDISKWDVSNITDMHGMFWGCKNFNKDISDWNVYNVTNISKMFWGCEAFNQDISKWDVSNVTDMYQTFHYSKSFNQDISNWNVSNVKYANFVFSHCPIEEKYKPKFI